MALWLINHSMCTHLNLAMHIQEDIFIEHADNTWERE